MPTTGRTIPLVHVHVHACLVHAESFLKDTALRWFEHHKEEITSWETFATAVQDNFRQTDA